MTDHIPDVTKMVQVDEPTKERVEAAWSHLNDYAKNRAVNWNLDECIATGIIHGYIAHLEAEIASKDDACYLFGPAASGYIEAIEQKMEWYAVDSRKQSLIAAMREAEKALAPAEPEPVSNTYKLAEKCLICGSQHNGLQCPCLSPSCNGTEKAGA